MYLNLIQIAESFGVSESVVEGWTKNEGLPHTLDRGRFVFDRAQVVHWAVARGLAAQAGFLAPETSVFATGLRLEPLLKAGGIWRDVVAAEVVNVFDRIVAALPAATPPVRQMLAQRLRSPGGITWGGIGGGFALPHPSTRIALGRDSGILALLILRDTLVIPGNGMDGVPIARLFFFIAPSPRAHLDILGRLSRMLARGPLRERLVKSANDNEILAALATADAALLSTLKPEVKS
jgi:nitrogen PTS system EIIA component